MLKFAFLIFGKDLRIILSGTAAIVQAVLLGLLLIFIFSVSKETGVSASPQEAATIFWLSSTFCQILIFNQLYAIEEANSARECLILAPYAIQGVWLGKSICGFFLLLLSQIFFAPALMIFLGQTFSGPFSIAFGSIFIANLGISLLGALLGAIAQGQTGRESLLSIILFPLLLPILLAGISLCSIAMGGNANADPGLWLGVGCAFDAIFFAAGLTLFGFLYQGD